MLVCLSSAMQASCSPIESIDEIAETLNYHYVVMSEQNQPGWFLGSTSIYHPGPFMFLKGFPLNKQNMKSVGSVSFVPETTKPPNSDFHLDSSLLENIRQSFGTLNIKTKKLVATVSLPQPPLLSSLELLTAIFENEKKYYQDHHENCKFKLDLVTENGVVDMEDWLNCETSKRSNEKIR